MNPKYYQTVPRKKVKTDLLSNDKYLNQFILDTRYNTAVNLEEMIKSYTMVVFKPDIGGGGKNVGFINKSDDGYSVKLGVDTYNITSIKKVYSYIKKINSKKEFILQKGVDLLKHDNSPFDIRIEIQKPYDEWKITGIVAKVAGKDRLVTNRHSGGCGIVVEKVFDNVSHTRYKEIMALLNFIGLRTSRLLNKKYIGLREIGVDIGINKEYEPYIFEVNTKPQYGVFRQAGDVQMYKRIVECNKTILKSIDYIKREL